MIIYKCNICSEELKYKELASIRISLLPEPGEAYRKEIKEDYCQVCLSGLLGLIQQLKEQAIKEQL